MLLITFCLYPKMPCPSAAFVYTIQIRPKSGKAQLDAISMPLSNQGISHALHLLDPHIQVSPQLWQTNLPHHPLSLHNNTFQTSSTFLKFLPLISIFFYLIKWSSQRKKMISDRKLPQPNTQTFLRGDPSCPPPFRQSRGADTTISPSDLWILLPPSTFRIFNHHLSFYFQYFTTFLQLSLLCF